MDSASVPSGPAARSKLAAVRPLDSTSSSFWLSPWTLSIAARVVVALVAERTYASPDEFWQGPEVAHRLVWGNGFLCVPATPDNTHSFDPRLNLPPFPHPHHPNHPAAARGSGLTTPASAAGPTLSSLPSWATGR
jgi:hypothetical protein